MLTAYLELSPVKIKTSGTWSLAQVILVFQKLHRTAFSPIISIILYDEMIIIFKGRKFDHILISISLVQPIAEIFTYIVDMFL